MFTNTVLCTLCGLAVWADKNPLFFNVHEYNITHKEPFVKGFFAKVIHNAGEAQKIASSSRCFETRPLALRVPQA